MKRMLNKEILQEVYHITNVTEDGKVYAIKRVSKDCHWVNIEKELNVRKIPCKHKHSGITYYPGIGLYNYNTKKCDTIILSNIVYAWFNDDYDINKDIDHIDANPFNNNLSNLQQLTREQNLHKRTKNINQYYYLRKKS